MSSLSAVRITASRGSPASSRQAICVYFSSARRKSMSCTAISRTVVPTEARTQRSVCGAESRIERPRQLLQQRLGIERRLCRAQPLLQSQHGFGEARRLDGLDQVVERALRKRLHGVLVERGHEHQVRAAPDVLRGFDARLARHLHVEKADVRPMRFEQIDGFAAVARLRDDLELGPGAGEQAHQRLAQQRLVVGDERGHAAS